MARERDQNKGRKTAKSGWNKPDGTPLRRRKGDYFPDREIEDRKPAKKRPFTERTGSGPDRSKSRREDGPSPEREKKYSSDDRGKPRRDTRSSPDRERKFSSDDRGRDERSSPDREKKYSSDDRGKPRRDDRPSSERERPFRGKEKKFSGDRRKTTSGPRRSSSTSGTRSTPRVEGSMRLNRYIANAGICSRREADDLITAGLVTINGKLVTELGTKVMPGDQVRFHDRVLKSENLVYVLLNKPKDFITTTDDPENRKTVMSLIENACRERILPVGRLDRNTTGLLLFTNDGDMARKLTHPSGNVTKIYQVELDKNFTQKDLLQAAQGVELDDGVAAFDEIAYASPTEKNIIGVELHSGKNRVVRRIFEALGYQVKKLDRTVFAGLTKKDLPRGRWRHLTELEVSMLKMLKK